MGDVHKFPRPPKNKRQFEGYKPTPPGGPLGPSAPRRGLRDWQKSLIAWTLLVLVATALWALDRMV